VWDSNTELCVASPWEQMEYCTAQTVPVNVAVLATVATGTFKPLFFLQSKMPHSTPIKNSDYAAQCCEI
jgi:hypothetical protein